MEAGLVALLNADATVSSLVGSRIFPVMIPEHNMPVNSGDPACLSYFVATQKSTYTVGLNEYNERRVQFDAWAVTYAACKSIVAAVRNVLDGYVGALSDGARIITALRENETDFFESDSRVYRVMFEYRIRFVEP